jgi:hypothetical protein
MPAFPVEGFKTQSEIGDATDILVVAVSFVKGDFFLKPLQRDVQPQ